MNLCFVFSRYLIVIVPGLLAPLLLVAQMQAIRWTPVDIPPGGQVTSLAEIDDDMFAATYGAGVYHSPDRGESWAQSNTGLTNSNVQDIVAVDGILLAAAGGVYRSEDKGQSWQAINDGFSGLFLYVYDLSVYGSRVFAGTTGGAYYSDDYGATWTFAHRDFPQVNVTRVVGTESRIFALIHEQGLARVDLATDSWEMLETGIPDIKSLYVDDKLLAVGTFRQGFHVSADLGDSWRRIGEGVESTWIYDIVKEDNTWYVATAHGVYTSVDDAEWSSLNPELEDYIFWKVLPARDYVFLGSIGEGVLRQEESGPAEFISKGISSHTIANAWTAGDALFIDIQFKGTYGSKANPDTEWHDVGLDLPLWSVKLVAGDADDVYLGASQNLFWSRDGGLQWSERFPGERLPGITAMLRQDDALLGFAKTSLFRILDDGTWNVQDFEAGITVNDVVDVNGTVAIATDGAGVLLSDDKGRTWKRANQGLSDGKVRKLWANDDILLAGCEQNIFRSDNGGESWVSVNHSKRVGNTFRSVGNAVTGIHELDGVLYVGSAFANWYSTNSGDTWIELSQNGLPANGWYSSLLLQGRDLYLASYGKGLFHARIPTEVTAVEGSESGSMELRVRPLAAEEKLELVFSVARAGTVTVLVYDVRGRTLKSVYVGFVPAGEYRRLISMRDLAAGTYFCVLHNADGTIARVFTAGR